MTLAKGADWGTVPAWVGAILTGGSLLLGFYILLRDRRTGESSQARAFACHWISLEGDMPGQEEGDLPFRFDVQMYNSSDSVIVEPTLFAVPRKKRKVGDRYDRLLREGMTNAEHYPWIQRQGEFLLYGKLRKVSKNVHEGRAFNEEPGLAVMAPSDGDRIYMELLFDPLLYDWYIYFQDGAGRIWRRDVRSQKLKKVKKYDELDRMRRD